MTIYIHVSITQKLQPQRALHRIIDCPGSLASNEAIYLRGMYRSMLLNSAAPTVLLINRITDCHHLQDLAITHSPRPLQDPNSTRQNRFDKFFLPLFGLTCISYLCLRIVRKALKRMRLIIINFFFFFFLHTHSRLAPYTVPRDLVLWSYRH